jgi:ketosteroid isomerase-like protein
MTLALLLNPLAEASTADEAAVKTVVESVATLADRSEFEALERLFADEILVDYSSLSGQPADVKSPRALMTEWAGILPGFDRTRHDLSDISATIDGARATAIADVVAGHWIAGDYWQVDGHYDYELVRDGNGWKITAITFNLEGETGSRDVFGPAIEAAKAEPPPYLQRQQTRQVVMDFLTGLEEKDMDKVNGVWAEDAVQDMPYVPAGWPNKVVGREALIQQYAGWPTASGTVKFTDGIVFRDTTDPRTVFVEYKGVVDIVPTGLTYRQTYGGLFHVEDGKITLFREYFDPREFARAFGLNQ